MKVLRWVCFIAVIAAIVNIVLFATNIFQPSKAMSISDTVILAVLFFAEFIGTFDKKKMEEDKDNESCNC